MRCRERDILVIAYFLSQSKQARAVSALMKRRLNTTPKLAALRMDVVARKTELEAHYARHGCRLN
jgi:hypothetical protein